VLLVVEEVQAAEVVVVLLPLHQVVDVVDLPVPLLRPRRINLINNIIKIEIFIITDS
jgi:hypothetical protein